MLNMRNSDVHGLKLNKVVKASTPTIKPEMPSKNGDIWPFVSDDIR